MSTRRLRRPKRGCPPGALSFDANVAKAFGGVVLEAQLLAGIFQEALAHAANVERSYFGRIERTQSQPTLHVTLKIAAALGNEGGVPMSVPPASLRHWVQLNGALRDMV